MNKKQFNLTEGELKKIVKETINELLNEDGEQGIINNNMNQQQATQQQSQQQVTTFEQNLARHLNAMYKLLENNRNGIQAISEMQQYNNRYLKMIAENIGFRR